MQGKAHYITHYGREYRIEEEYEIVSDVVRYRIDDGKEVTYYQQPQRSEYRPGPNHQQLVEMHLQCLEQQDHFVHPGLTTAQLRHPEIRDAWEELKIMCILKGI